MNDIEILATPGKHGVPEGLEITRTSVIITKDININEWLALTEQMMLMEGSLAWWIGDLLRYGEMAYGEKYAQAADLTGRSPGTLANWVRIAKAFPPDRRNADAAWWAHQELAGCDKNTQDEWLQAVVENNWTKEQFRISFRETQTGDSPPRPAPQQIIPKHDNGLAPSPEIAASSEERITWIIEVSIPETADIIRTDEAVRRSAVALEMVLEELQTDARVSMLVNDE